MVEKEYNLEFATSMVHQFMPGFSSQKNAIILCDSGYIKQNFVSILSSKVSVEQSLYACECFNECLIHLQQPYNPS